MRYRFARKVAHLRESERVSNALTAYASGIRAARRRGMVERGANDPIISLDQWADMFQDMTYQGVNYSLPGATAEAIGGNFRGLSSGAYKSDSIVFACCALRMSVFSQVRFQFRQIRNGKPGQLFGTDALAPLEQPWQGGTTGDLLAKMIQHADLAGNWFGTNRYGGIRTLRPDWVSIIFGSDDPDLEAQSYDPDAVVLGYAFQPGGLGSGRDPIIFDVNEVAHFAPTPDPEAQFRGMSWLQPVIREVMADKAMTEHKITFLERGGTPNTVVKFDINDLSKFQSMIEKFSRDHEGIRGAYRTMYLAAGMDVTTVGTNMQQLDFKVVQGAGETRIAAAAEAPAVLVGLSEGLQGSSLNAGNYSSARRRFSDGPMRYLWGNACGSLQQIIQMPERAELWIDTSGCAFLQEDEKDAAEIQSTEAQTIKALIDAGYKPDAVIDAVTSRDFTRLTGQHTNLFSVQLQPPGTTAIPSGNGNGGGAIPPQRARELVAAAITQED